SQNERAIEDYDSAIRLDGTKQGSYFHRGSFYLRLGEFERAVKDASEAIHLDSNYASAHSLRGSALVWQGETERAVEDFETAIRLDSKKPDPYARFAWALATLPRDEFRDGPRAVELATKACE